MASDGEEDGQNYESSCYSTDDGNDYTDEVDSNVDDDDDGESWHPEEEEVDDDDEEAAKKKKAAAAVDLSKIDRRYRNLSEDQVRARQDADTANVGELFAIPPGFAAVLLRHYKWSLVELQDRLFCDGDRASRYMHFYERWAAHGKARQSALDDMADLDGCAEQLSGAVAMPVTEFCFLTEAYQQIAECRRLLRWTYAYGYYHLGAGLDGDEERRTMVECAQGEAERQLEKLHECAEHGREELLTEVEQTVKWNPILKDSEDEELKKKMEEKAGEMVLAYRQKLAGLTGICKIFFRNLVKTFQDGLSEARPAVAGAAAATIPAEGSDDPADPLPSLQDESS